MADDLKMTWLRLFPRHFQVFSNPGIGLSVWLTSKMPYQNMSLVDNFDYGGLQLRRPLDRWKLRRLTERFFIYLARIFCPASLHFFIQRDTQNLNYKTSKKLLC